MKKLVLLVILAFSLVLSPLATTMASTPKLINYQGKLKNLDQTGPLLVVFEIFEDAAGGTALWIEQKNVTPSQDGTFSTYLGETNPIDLKFDKQYYVQITVGNNQPFPRTKLTSAPSAFYAADADTALYAFESGLAMDVAPEAIGLDNLAPEVLTAGGDLMGMYPNPQIRPDAILDNIPDGSITTEMLSPNISTSPSGPAGGDMTGTYPDPLIAVGAVKTDRIADGAVTNDKIADMTIMDAKIMNLDAAKLFNLGALAGTVAVATDATIDGDGTNAMPLGLADDAVTSVKILDGEVMTADLMNDAVTNDKLADDAVMSANIMDGQVMNADLAVDAVMSTNIMDGQVMTADLMDDAVTNDKLAVDAVRMENIDVNGGVPTDGEFLSWDDVDGEMRWVEPTVVTSAPLTGNGQTATPVTLDPTFGNVNELLIRDAAGWSAGLIGSDNIMADAITSSELADNSVMTNHIVDGEVMNADLAVDAVMSTNIMDGQVMTADLMDGAVTTLKIADGNVMTVDIADVNVTEAKLADNAVSTRTIATNAVTEPKMADLSISTRTIQDAAVTTAKIADDAVTTAKLFNGAVTNLKIADLAVTNEKVSSQGQPSGKIMKADGSGGVSWEDDEGIILPWTGSYDGPGDAFTLTHTGLAGNGSAAVFNSTTATNPDPTVEIIKDVDAGAGPALAVRGIGVQGQNYIATFTNNNLNEGRTVLMVNDAPTQQPLVDPGTPGDLTDDYVNPDPTGTDVEDATLVLKNNDGAASGQKLALKTYGSIQANSAIQGTDLIAHNGEIIVNNTGLAGGTLFLTEDAMEKVSNPLAATETFQMFNTGGDFDLDLDGHLDVRNQARIGDLVDENQVTVDGALTAVAIDLSNAGVPNVSPAGPGTATTVPTANADLLVNGDAELTGSLNLGGSADTYNSVNDIYISTDLTTLNPPAPAPSTTVIFESNDAQLISARAVEDALLNHDLQVAYNNGNSITSTDAQGDIDFNLEEATDFTITGANVGNDVIIDGAGYLDAQVNIINTSVGNAVIVEDDLEPDADDTYNLGSDDVRWSNAYVNGGSVHVGPSAGQFNGTELAIGYAANAATLTVDNTLMANFNAATDMITFDPDGASALPGQDELTISDAADMVMINADGAGGQEVIVDGANDIFSVDADGDTFNEINVAAAGVTIDGNSDNANNVTITGSAFNVDADGSGQNNITANGTTFTVDADNDTFNEINVAAAGVTIDGNSTGTANVTVTGAAFGVNADDANGNEIFANGAAVHLNANGDVNIDVDVNGTSVDLDPNSNGTDNFSFAETGVTISTTTAPGDVVLSDAGIAANGATQTFAFTNGGAGNLDVSLDGSLTGLNSGHALGTVGTNANVLNVDGVATAGVLAATDYELTVTGDANITGTAQIGALSMLGDIDMNENDILEIDDLDGGAAIQINQLNNGTITTGTGQIDFNGNVDANSGLDVIGATTAAGTITQTGAGNQVTFAGNVDANNGLDVIGATTAAGTITQTGAGNQVTFAGNVDANNGLDVANAALTASFTNNTIGSGADATSQLTVLGTASPTTTSAAGAVTAAPADNASEFTVQGDAQIDGSLTIGAGGTEHSVDNIFVAADLVGNLFPAPVAIDGQSNDGELVTALAVQTALINHDLQVAYNNGNTILTNGNDIDFDLNGGDDLNISTAAIGDDVIVTGLGIIDAQVDIENSVTGTVIVDDNLDVRDALFNNSIDATPLAINDDVTATMQDANDNFEIIGAAAGTGTAGNLLFVDKNTGGDNSAALLVNTNLNGINVENPDGISGSTAYNTTLGDAADVGYNANMTAGGRGFVANVGAGTGVDIAASTGTGINSVISGSGTGMSTAVVDGVGVQTTATTGQAVVATNEVASLTDPTVQINNNIADANGNSDAYALEIINGHTALPSETVITSYATNGNIAIGTKTVVRCNTAAGVPINTLTLEVGTKIGQIVIITNEDTNAGADMTISGNVLGSQTVQSSSAAQFVWTGTYWVIMD